MPLCWIFVEWCKGRASGLPLNEKTVIQRGKTSVATYVPASFLNGQSEKIFNLQFFNIRTCLDQWPMG